MPDMEQKKKFRAPEGFYYGVEYTREDINENLRENGPLLFTDEDGHGTKMISAACGYDRTNGFVGAAKDADIAVFYGHPFDFRSRCAMTLINGRIVHDEL